MNKKSRMAALIVAVALSLVIGILVASANGPVIWKRFCPATHDVVMVEDGPGTTVLCELNAGAE